VLQSKNGRGRVTTATITAAPAIQALGFSAEFLDHRRYLAGSVKAPISRVTKQAEF
jgi:hypothetical protein